VKACLLLNTFSDQNTVMSPVSLAIWESVFAWPADTWKLKK